MGATNVLTPLLFGGLSNRPSGAAVQNPGLGAQRVKEGAAACHWPARDDRSSGGSDRKFQRLGRSSVGNISLSVEGAFF
jgi:hypothetical protein